MERGWRGLSEFALIRSAEICPIRAIRVLFQLAERLQPVQPRGNRRHRMGI